MQHEDELEQRGAGASVFSALGLTLLGTTCCALPITLIALGAGGAVASVASALPWLVALSEYKLATFGITAVALGYSWWRVREVRKSGTCSVTTAKRLRFQNRVLLGASAVLGFSIFSAYALLPLVMWFDDL